MISASVGMADLQDRIGAERMRRVMASLRDSESTLTTVGGLVLEQNRAHFDKAVGKSRTGVSFDREVTWAQLTPRYFRRKSMSGRANWLMVSGRGLMDSLSVRGAKGNVFRVSEDHVDVGTRNPVAGYHDTPWKRTHGKARRTVFLTKGDRTGILDVIVEATRAAWTGSMDRLRAAYARAKGRR